MTTLPPPHPTALLQPRPNGRPPAPPTPAGQPSVKGKMVPFMTASLKDVSIGEITVPYDSKHTIAKLTALVVEDQKVKLSEKDPFRRQCNFCC
ncbi:hypothetical protein PAHAL_2G110000 [Panicum hallii]|uniref:Uncharacterized protein n=1 Tax=Panicum hallii TaxID=206008 RepID=A0A2S3GXF4_9POAL|nr:hypothetical protein PAHAL_2G110000 [Panicum hallii]